MVVLAAFVRGVAKSRGRVGELIEPMSRRGSADPLGAGPLCCGANAARAFNGIASGRTAFWVTHTLWPIACDGTTVHALPW